MRKPLMIFVPHPIAGVLASLTKARVPGLTRVSAVGATLLVILFVAIRPSEARRLTFEDRVRAQEAIERVRYGEQIGATRPFEEVVPRADLEDKVRTYLKQSLSLDVFWKSPVTAEMLHRELQRMAAHTWMPHRFLQLYSALDNDPLLIQECLARPALVERLARDHFAYDVTIHARTRKEAEALRAALATGRLDPLSQHPARHLVTLSRVDVGRAGQRAEEHGSSAAQTEEVELEPDAFDRYQAGLPARVGDVGPVEEERDAFVTRVVLHRTADQIEVAAFVVPKLSWDRWWTSVEGGLDVASAGEVASATIHLPEPRVPSEGLNSLLCRGDDAWIGSLSTDLLPPRTGQTAVWTGSLVIVWGGLFFQSGARYDPTIDNWTPMSTINAPTARSGHTAIWAGTRMVVWGGFDGQILPVNTGGRYNPATDTWTSTSASQAPSGRAYHTAVWTGELMVVWGGLEVNFPPVYADTGGRYDPATDTWTPTSTINAPSRRQAHTAVWTGSLMIVWGGVGPTSLVNTGGRYRPLTDTWEPTSLTGAPSRRVLHSAVWTGSLMIVWGGRDIFSRYTGARYDPAADAWAPVSTINAPPRSGGHIAFWTGGLMVVWGGDDEFGIAVNTGGRYEPITNTWTRTSSANAPSSRESPAAVWTQDLMIVWGGTLQGVPVSGGGLYEPGQAADAFDGDLDGFSVCQGDCDDGNPALHPGAGELCDDVDNDCDGTIDGFPTSCGTGQCVRTGACIAGVDNCLPGSPSGEVCDGIDNDCDGFIDNAPPPSGSPVVTIGVPAQTAVLAWEPLPEMSSYDVVVGDLGTLLGTGGDFTPAIRSCLAYRIAENSVPLPDSPDPGSCFFYLVRGVSCGGPGTYDSGDPAQVGLRDDEINTSSSGCNDPDPCGDGYCDPNYENACTCPIDCVGCCGPNCWPD